MPLLKNPFNLESTTQHFDLTHGFLPKAEPIAQLPRIFNVWEKTAIRLPKLLLSEHLRTMIESLPEFPVNALTSLDEIERAMLLLSYLGHAYVWQAGQQPAVMLPRHLAMAWYAVSELLQRPPILSYASYALYNWQKINPDGPIALGNIALLQNFLGGIDEEWFILIHVDIEHRATPALQAILPALQAVCLQNLPDLAAALQTIAAGLEAMVKTLERMPEHCDPYIYYNRVRPYIHGWKANPALPLGIIYDGVAAYQQQPVKFKGETGAQSTIIPVLDAALGITHANNPLKEHLQEMRQYMPLSHRRFLETVEQGPKIRDFILQQPASDLLQQIKKSFNQVIELIHAFRTTHIHYAAQYIQKQSASATGNPTDVGTGGTPFMEYLRKHQQETLHHLIP